MNKQLLNALDNLSVSLVEISNELIKSRSSKSSIIDSNFSNQMIEMSKSIIEIRDISISILKTQENLIKNQETILNTLKENDSKLSEIKSSLDSIDKSQKTIIELNKESSDEIKKTIADSSEVVKGIGESIVEKISNTETIKEVVKSIIDRSDSSSMVSGKSYKSTIKEIAKSIKDSLIPRTTKESSRNGNSTLKETIKYIKESFKLVERDSKTENDTSKIENNSILNDIYKTLKQISKTKFETNNILNEVLDHFKSVRGDDTSVKPKNTTVEIGQKSKEIGILGKIKDNTKDIKSGVSTILLIASGILAIGLAFKIIGQVDFASVISLSIALPLIAIAFHKISEMGLDPKSTKNVIISVLGISTAIALSSFILSTISPISLSQSLTMILIAGTFSVVGFGISKFMSSFSGIDNSKLSKSAFILPILMIAISSAIAGSSYLLGLVKPIGLFQAITSIMIAGVFSTISLGISKIVSTFKDIDVSTAMRSSIILPITMMAISSAIAGSSYLLGLVKPIGLFQAVTSILIAGVFTTISFGLSRLIKSFRGVSISDAIKSSTMIPIVMIGMSAAIAGSSYLLGLVKPIGLFQAITSILIAGTFTVISYGISRLVRSFKDISPGDALKTSITMPIVLIALSGSIMASSLLLSMVRPIGLFQAITSILIAGIFVALSYTVKPLMIGLKGVSYGDVLKGTIVLLALSGAISAVSYIIGSMKDLTMSQVLSFIGIGVSIGLVSIIFGGSIKILNKIGGPSDFIKGTISILAISTSIALSSLILSIGDYTSYPSIEWALNSGLSLAMFAIGAVLLGTTAMTPMFWVGLGAIVVTSLAIVASSHILGMGDYSKYPNLEWSLNSGLSLAMFAIGATLVGTVAMTPMFWVGLGAIVVTALTITATSHIIGMGDYSKYPDMSWSLGVGLSIAGFGLGATLLGFQAINPLFYAGLGVILLVAGTIAGVSYVLSLGNYEKSPPMDWAMSVGLLVSGFGLGAAALGLVSPLVILGLLAATSVAGTIWLIDEIFSTGSFKKYPTSNWTNPTLSIITKFGISMMKLAFALPLITLGSISSLAIAGTIVLIDKAFSNGRYIKYPSVKWTSGVFTTLRDMSNLLSYIRNNLGFSDLALGAMKIWGVTKSLKMIDESLSSGKFDRFPSEKWNVGVKSSIIAMLDLMSIPSFVTLMRERISSFFGVGISDIVESIVNIDRIFSMGKYKFYPNQTWVSGVVSSINEFIKMGGNKSITSSISDIIKSGLGSGLEDIAKKIVSIDRILSIGKFNKFPSIEWVKSISTTFKSLNNLDKLEIPDISDSMLDRLNYISIKISSIKPPTIPTFPNWIGGFASEISKLNSINFDKSSINLTLDNISSIYGKISNMKYSEILPSEDWTSKIKSSVTDITSIIDHINKLNLDQNVLNKIENILTVSSTTLNKISSMKYPDPLDSLEYDKIGKVASSMSNILIGLDTITNTQIIDSRLKVESIIETIGIFSQSFSKISTYKYENSDWVSSLFNMISTFGKSFTEISNLPTNLKDRSDLLSSSIIEMSKSLSSGSEFNPDMDWVDNFSTSISKISDFMSRYPSIDEIMDKKNRISELANLIIYFRDILSNLSNVSAENIGFESSFSSLEKISMVFDKMSKSVDGFVDSLENINTDKISSINSITNSMVLLNTIGDKQFEKIIQRIEERSDRLTDAINSYNKDKSIDNTKQTNISTPNYIENKLEIPEMKNILERMETMTALLADISSVVGSRGALKNYIMSIQGDISIGKK